MTTATKGADLDRRMYALGPTALADEAASLLWDDGRRSLYEGDAAGCDAAAAPVTAAASPNKRHAARAARSICSKLSFGVSRDSYSANSTDVAACSFRGGGHHEGNNLLHKIFCLHGEVV